MSNSNLLPSPTVFSTLRRWGCTSLFSFAALASATGCDDDGESEDIDTLRQATVFIEAQGALRAPGQAEITSNWSGSGAFISSDGYIVTNNHVAGAAVVRHVHVHGEDSPRAAQLIGSSECSDLALLKVEGEVLSTLDWYAGEISPGLEVTSAGFPGVTGGGNYTLTKGNISTEPGPLATGWAAVQQAVFHTAQINSGNSGGPLVETASQQMVGVNYAGQSAEGAHIAIAASEAQTIIEQMKLGQDVHSIGISGSVLLLDDGSGRPVPAGVWVSSVRPGSFADDVKILPGDLIVELGGIDLNSAIDEGNYSLQSYCNVLRSNDPKLGPLPIKVHRLDAGVICEGQLNGRPLQGVDLVDGQAIPCPITAGQGGGSTGGGGTTGGGTTGGGTTGGGATGGGVDSTGDTGGNSTGMMDTTGGDIPTIYEVEPNEDPSTAQRLQPPMVVIGQAKDGDPAIGLEPDKQSGTPGQPNFGEDLYTFVLNGSATVTVVMESEYNADFDVFLYDDYGALIAKSDSQDTGDEALQVSLPAGGYIIVVDAWETVTQDRGYAVGLLVE